jgi:hypothetical protein
MDGDVTEEVILEASSAMYERSGCVTDKTWEPANQSGNERSFVRSFVRKSISSGAQYVILLHRKLKLDEEKTKQCQYGPGKLYCIVCGGWVVHLQKRV